MKGWFEKIMDDVMHEAHVRNHPACPYCREEIDMTTPDDIFVTYWGEGPPIEMDCPHCYRSVFIKEIVTRAFSAHKTPAEDV